MWVSKNEIACAKKYDILSYLRSADPGELVKTAAGEYRLRSHDSFVISNGLWHWYSKDIGGRSAIDYLIKVKNYDFPQAVKEVNRAMKGKSPSVFLPKNKEKALKLPGKCEDAGIVKAYLLSRAIDEDLIDWLIEKGTLYESSEHHSAVFVGYDADGKPAHGAYRSTDKSGYKGDYSGSNKKYCFRIERRKSPLLHVFEGAIDLLSYITICKDCGIDISDRSLISTAGISVDSNKLPLALEEFLRRHPEVEEIVLQLDNDDVGRRAAEGIRDILKDRYRVVLGFIPKGKDYNEYLMMTRREKDNGKIKH